MRRGFAITIVYLGLLLVPIGDRRVDRPAARHPGQQPRPEPARVRAGRAGLRRSKNERCASWSGLQHHREAAGAGGEAPRRIGDAASVLGDIGLGVVNSLFALFTILVLDGVPARQRAQLGGPLCQLRPPEHAGRDSRARSTTWPGGGRLRRRRARSGDAGRRSPPTSCYDPRRAVRRARSPDRLSSPIWCRSSAPRSAPCSSGWSRVRRLPDGDDRLGDLGDRLPAVREPRDPAADAEARGQRAPFITIVAVLFGSTLLGMLGALVAIPIAASMQILMREYFDPRTLSINARSPRRPPRIPRRPRLRRTTRPRRSPCQRPRSCAEASSSRSPPCRCTCWRPVCSRCSGPGTVSRT